jgi:hypothetical protein
MSPQGRKVYPDRFLVHELLRRSRLIHYIASFSQPIEPPHKEAPFWGGDVHRIRGMGASAPINENLDRS